MSDQVKEDEIDKPYSTHGRDEKHKNPWSENLKGRINSEDRWRRIENTRMDLMEIG
jgi:hypothetical protein